MSFEKISSATLRGHHRIDSFRSRDNGLAVIALADPSVPLVSYQTWIPVGSAIEERGKSGLAHFFEHLMFTGTRTHPAGTFDRVLESHGGDSNAATWLDWTYYKDTVPSSALGDVIALESDRLENLLLTSETIEAEREVILNERRERVEDDVSGFLFERLMYLVFGDHGYGLPTIGTESDIRGLDRDDLTSFYREHYAPDGATIVVVGDFQTNALLSDIEAAYGSIPRSTKMAELVFSPPPPPDKKDEVHFRPVSSDRLLMGWIGPGQRTREWGVLEVIAHVLSGGPSSRLYRELVVEREFASSVSASMLPLRQAGLFEISVHCTTEHPFEHSAQVVDEIIEDIAHHGVSDEELAKTKSGMLTDFWSEMTTTSGKAESLGHHQIVCGDYRALLEFPSLLESISTNDLKDLCREHLGAESRSSVVARPE